MTIGVASATQADLSVTNAAAPIRYSAAEHHVPQTVTNGGPASATRRLDRNRSRNTTFVSLAGSRMGLHCRFTLHMHHRHPCGQHHRDFTFVVTVNTTAASDRPSPNGSVSTATSDPNPGNNSATASV